MKRKSIICLAVSALLVMSGCMMEEDIRVTGVSFQSGVLNLRVGQEDLLYAIVTPSNAAHPEVNWATSNEFAAEVTAAGQEVIPDVGVVFKGLVNARGEGKTTITATTIDGRKVATATVNTYDVRNAKPPTVTVEFEQYATYEQGVKAVPLVVSATSLDGGSLSYQWWCKKGETLNDMNSVPGPGEPIPGATGVTYTPPTNVPGVTRYCVIVTNYHSPGAVDGNQTATTQSDFIDVEVTPSDNVTHAEKPTIIVQPRDTTYVLNAPTEPLTVKVTHSDGGTLTYLWYSNIVNSTTGENSIVPPATSSTFTPPSYPLGTLYYYAVVTNTNNAETVNGYTTATDTTRVARINIVAPETVVNAAKPVIDVEPRDTSYVTGATVKPLTVEATSPDNGDLSYQWFKTTTGSKTGGTAIDKEDKADYLPPFPTATKTWYYVVVTNTNNDIVYGSKTDTVTSRAVSIELVTSAAQPMITTHPVGGKTYEQHSTEAIPLTVVATSPDNGTLTYKWFRNTENSTTGGTSVGESETCTPATNEVGPFYYYVFVTTT